MCPLVLVLCLRSCTWKTPGKKEGCCGSLFSMFPGCGVHFCCFLPVFASWSLSSASHPSSIEEYGESYFSVERFVSQFVLGDHLSIAVFPLTRIHFVRSVTTESSILNVFDDFVFTPVRVLICCVEVLINWYVYMVSGHVCCCNAHLNAADAP